MTSNADPPATRRPGLSTVLRHGLGRTVATAVNATEVLRFGGLDTGERPSPYALVAEGLHHRLRRYFPGEAPAHAAPVLLVPPLMLSAEVWDVSPATSAVAHLRAEGLDPWVVDFGDPGVEPQGLRRTLSDHVLAVSEAIDVVREHTGQDVVLAGYSQGGMFCYQTAAYRRSEGIAAIATFGSPVDARAPLPVPVDPELAARLADSVLETGILRHLALPSWAARTGFKLLSPAKSLRSQLRFLLALHDREALLPRERQRRFLEVDGFTAWSGPAIAELFELFVAQNRMLAGGFTIGDRLVTLADIAVPILSVVGTSDTIGHPESVRAIGRAAPRAAVFELTLRAGHFGLVVGSTASERSWPAVAAWARWAAHGAPLPDDIVPAEQVEPAGALDPRALPALASQALDLGAASAVIAYEGAKDVLRFARGLVADVPAQLPRLARLSMLDPDTVVSLGLLLDEQARRAPDDIVFLFADRAHRQRDVKVRVDNVVKGLVEVGVRQGDRVGVLMRTRPSAFTVLAALSRLGATAVLLRPDGDLRRELDLGAVTRVVSDPEHAPLARKAGGLDWCVLGGGGRERTLEARVVDLERIDPASVRLPAWYRPNPHRARDLAFVLFSGEGESTRALAVSNRRWALSALGTATAASLRPGDTVYSTTPLHHSSALFMSIGGAIAGGARFAVATAEDSQTFWDEVRRYGATHVAYTWTSLRPIALAPPDPAERHHPIRLFMGSGMPPDLWTRLTQRFAGTRVLEFYASADHEAILANVHGHPVGSLGRPLPGTAEVRVIGFDPVRRTVELDEHGMARECAAEEPGLLVVRAAPGEIDGAATSYRGLFEPDDVWISTGDLFRRDRDGDHWRIDAVAALVDTAHGPVAGSIARDAVAALPAVDLCVAYDVPEGEHRALTVALTLRPGAAIEAADLDRAVEHLDPVQRPAWVQTVGRIALTTWHRPLTRSLRRAGVPKPSSRRRVWRLEDGRYRELPLP